MKVKAKAVAEIYDLDGDGHRYALSVGGLVRFVGSRDECMRRAKLLLRPEDERERQDQMLGRACS